MKRFFCALVFAASSAFGQLVPNTTRGDLPSFVPVEQIQTMCANGKVPVAASGLWTCGDAPAGPEGPQGPPGASFAEIMLCAGTATQACMTWTNKSASYVEVTASASRTHMDFVPFSQFRVISLWNVAAVAADLQIHCDADATFGSQALLYQLDNPGAALVVGSWTNVPANECDTADGIFLRAGMLNGNTTEDPAVRIIRLQVR